MAGEEARTGHTLRLFLVGSAGDCLDARYSGAPLSHLLVQNVLVSPPAHPSPPALHSRCPQKSPAKGFPTPGELLKTCRMDKHWSLNQGSRFPCI